MIKNAFITALVLSALSAYAAPATRQSDIAKVNARWDLKDATSSMRDKQKDQAAELKIKQQTELLQLKLAQAKKPVKK